MSGGDAPAQRDEKRKPWQLLRQIQRQLRVPDRDHEDLWGVHAAAFTKVVDLPVRRPRLAADNPLDLPPSGHLTLPDGPPEDNTALDFSRNHRNRSKSNHGSSRFRDGRTLFPLVNWHSYDCPLEELLGDQRTGDSVEPAPAKQGEPPLVVSTQAAALEACLAMARTPKDIGCTR